MSAQERDALVADFKDAMTGRIDDRDYSLQEVVGIKAWFFGGSARYVFGLRMAQTLVEMKKQVAQQPGRGIRER